MQSQIDSESLSEQLESLKVLIAKQIDLTIESDPIRSKQEVCLDVFENLIVGVLLGEKEVAIIFQHLHYVLGYLANQENSQKLLQWICQDPIKKFLMELITNEYKRLKSPNSFEQILPVSRQLQIDEWRQQSNHEKAPQTPKINASQREKQNQAANQGSNNVTSAPDENYNKEGPDNIFEVVDLSLSKLNDDVSQKLESENERVLIYTHQQMVKELDYELENSPEYTSQVSNSQSSNQQQDVSSSKLQDENQQKIPPLFDDSRKYGHFLFGDKISTIEDLTCCENFQDYVIVKWQRRGDGSIPKPTKLSTGLLTYYCPQQLIDFYVKFIRNQK